MSMADLSSTARSDPFDGATMLLPADYPSHYARISPDGVAIIAAERRWTYAELDRASDSFVALMRDRGIGRGDCVAFHGRNSDLFFPVLFGAMRAGIILAPINWRNAAGETRHALVDSGARLTLVEREFVPVLDAADLPDVPRILVDGGADDLRAQLDAAAPAERAPVDIMDPVLLLYTSGTTGRPKGALTSQYAIAAQRVSEFESGHFNDWQADEMLFSPLPNFHIGGMSWAFTAFVRGLPVIITNDPSPRAILDTIMTHTVTRAFMVPLLVRVLIAELTSAGIARSPLRGIHYGAAAMDPQLLDRSVDVLGCRFLQYYGMTELCGSVTILGPSFHDTTRPHLLRSVGQALPGYQLSIRSPEGDVLPTGASGEIWIKGPSTTLGYWRQPAATAEVLIDGWYRSGDGGRLDEDGFLYLTDRIKDMIVTGGENVYPAEVEAVLRQHPAIADCAVFGLPHSKWGEGVTVAIELRPGHSVTEAQMISFARAHLAGYKIPRRYEFGVVLPRTTSGKVQRAILRTTYRPDQ